MNKRQPWLRFFTADWRGDAGLRAVGFAARGLWIDMLTLMHEATPYGHLVVNDQPLDAARLAARVGGSVKEVQALLDRLETEGVFSRTVDGAIFSRRMVADGVKAERDRLNGKEGGNPRIKANGSDKAGDNGGGGGQDNGSDKGGVNPQGNPQVKAHARTCAPVPLPDTREEDSVSSETDAGASAEPPSATDLLWQAGLPILRKLTGKSDGQCRSMLGRMRRDMQDDCPKLLLILQEASTAQHADPVAWLMAATSPSRESAAERRIRQTNETMRRLTFGEERPLTIEADFWATPAPRRLQ